MMHHQLITSRQNVRVKEAAKLRQRRQRERQRRFLIDGTREIQRAIDAGIDVLEAFVCQPLCNSDEALAVVDRLQNTSATLATVTPEVFEKLCFGQRTDGVVVVAKTAERRLEAIKLPPQPLVAVLAGLEKPGNVGATLRSADGAGVDAVLVADGQSDLMNPNTIRASLGTVFSLQVGAATTDAAIAWLREQRLPIVAARPDAKQLYTEVDYRGGAAIVLGREAQGLTAGWQAAEILGIRLPMHGQADSLNVSATAAVLFYEAWRQRTVLE